MSRPMRIAIFLTIAVAIACHGNSPTSPTRIPAATGTPPRYVLSGVLEGRASGAPGRTARFHFTLKYNDGSAGEGSAKAAWRSGNPQVVDVRAGGAARAVSRGRADVFASFSVSANTNTVV